VKFRQVSFRVERADVERAEALLNLAGALSLSLFDAEDSPLFEPQPGTTPLWERPGIHALFPPELDVAALTGIIRQTLPGAEDIDSRFIDAADWQAGLEQHVFVQRIAENLGVVPAQWDGAPPARNCVRLHMGLAFGTGRHPTTALCLQWLARHPPQGLAVLDFGCGSGVLAIAALTLGAADAVAIDHDPQAVAATRANARLNGVDATLRAGALEEFDRISVDLVLANILAGTLTQSVAQLAAMLRPGGVIVLSGVLAEQTAAVAQTYAERFESIKTTQRDGWACMSAVLR